MIKAVLFDVDGVLLDSLEANFRYYNAVFQKFGRKFVGLNEYRKKYYSLPVKEMLQDLMKLEGKELEEKFQEAKGIQHFSYLYKVPEGEKETIDELFNKYKLAIVTGRYDLESTFQTTGLEKHFSVIVKYGDYKKPKPDPEPLTIALKKLETDVKEMVYVGDSQDDLLAARAMGMKFICFYGVSKKKLAEADANVKTFAELPGEIEKISLNA